ncbi:protein PAM71-homolog, chloroplastic-like [Silene latifolia]|uniref:protein PAM71-homolog, chloroplastic-like n=1 Tax=Silene latifolia TaxID=37657 RepID=UPI003D77783F
MTVPLIKSPLLLFFGLKSIKDAWELPDVKAENKEGPELDDYAEAGELVSKSAHCLYEKRVLLYVKTDLVENRKEL